MTSIHSLIDIIDTISSFVNNSNSLKTIQLESEVSEIKEYPNVVYLTLIDSLTQTTIRATIFKSVYCTKLVIGSKISFQGSVKFYKNEIQISIKSYVLTGLGNAINSLNKLKEELALQGYYDNKKEILDNYSKIGIISSLNSAGLKDFVHTINSRTCGKEIFIYPAVVQGTSAPEEIRKAIILANKHNKAQVLALIRGGGSKEDLECFNDKIIATAIHESNLPLVTGIGHQIDISIADLVADKYFITPTATAQGLTKGGIFDNDEIMAELIYVQDLFMVKMTSYYDYLDDVEDQLQKCKDSIVSRLSHQLSQHELLIEKLRNNIQTNIDSKCAYFDRIDNQLETFKNDIVQKIDKALSAHHPVIEAIGPMIETKLSCYSNSVSLLGRPIIKSKISGREIRMASDLKKGRKYIIQFLDDTYEIKIT